MVLSQTFIGDFIKIATSSFYKSFVIKEKKAAQKFCQALLTQHLIRVEKKDLPKEFKRGIERGSCKTLMMRAGDRSAPTKHHVFQ